MYCLICTSRAGISGVYLLVDVTFPKFLWLRCGRKETYFYRRMVSDTTQTCTASSHFLLLYPLHYICDSILTDKSQQSYMASDLRHRTPLHKILWSDPWCKERCSLPAEICLICLPQSGPCFLNILKNITEKSKKGKKK